MIDERKRGMKGSMEIEERKINIQTNNGMFESIKGKLMKVAQEGN